MMSTASGTPNPIPIFAPVLRPELDEPVEAGDAVGPEVEARVLAAPAPLVVLGVVLGDGVTVGVKLVSGVVKVVVSRKIVKLPSTEKEISSRSSSLSPSESIPFRSFSRASASEASEDA